jgi:hypothetical protein
MCAVYPEYLKTSEIAGSLRVMAELPLKSVVMAQLKSVAMVQKSVVMA